MKTKMLALAAALFMIAVPAAPARAQEETVRLPGAQMSGGRPLMETLKARQTMRNLDERELPAQVLSNLLWAAIGVNRPDGRRTAPTAANRQEIEVYVALPAGLFVYDAAAHALQPKSAKDIRPFCGRQPTARSAPVVLLFVADFAKMTGAQESKDFYSAVDTGYISQNVYLFCASEELATVVMGAIDRNLLSREMELRPDQKVILIQPVGYPKPPAAN